jgi:galactokinase
MLFTVDSVCRLFHQHYKSAPSIVVRAPGRVNLIGEHTDYNDGFVLPMAIEQETFIAARRRLDGIANVYAANFERARSLPVGEEHRSPDEPWMDYLVGVAIELRKMSRELTGFDAVVGGNIPMGSGLSSSASLEMACLKMFEELGGFRLDGIEAARLGQRVENDFLGLQTGIMDQFVSRNALKGHALFLDCRTLIARHVKVAMPNACFIIVDTCVARGLVDSKYNERVHECQTAATRMAAELEKPPTSRLRDFTLEELNACQAKLDPRQFARARHVISENNRTLAACNALENGAASEMGSLMNASHDSLRDDYEVTCPELDLLVALGRAQHGCYGARMTGAGFGGATIHLVETSSAEHFRKVVGEQYYESTGLRPRILVSLPSAGAETLSH